MTHLWHAVLLQLSSASVGFATGVARMREGRAAMRMKRRLLGCMLSVDLRKVWMSLVEVGRNDRKADCRSWISDRIERGQGTSYTLCCTAGAMFVHSISPLRCIKHVKPEKSRVPAISRLPCVIRMYPITSWFRCLSQLGSFRCGSHTEWESRIYRVGVMHSPPA